MENTYPIYIFNLFFNDEVISKLAEESNRYYKERLEKNMGKIILIIVKIILLTHFPIYFFKKELHQKIYFLLYWSKTFHGNNKTTRNWQLLGKE